MGTFGKDTDVFMKDELMIPLALAWRRLGFLFVLVSPSSSQLCRLVGWEDELDAQCIRVLNAAKNRVIICS